MCVYILYLFKRIRYIYLFFFRRISFCFVLFSERLSNVLSFSLLFLFLYDFSSTLLSASPNMEKKARFFIHFFSRASHPPFFPYSFYYSIFILYCQYVCFDEDIIVRGGKQKKRR